MSYYLLVSLRHQFTRVEWADSISPKVMEWDYPELFPVGWVCYIPSVVRIKVNNWTPLLKAENLHSYHLFLFLWLVQHFGFSHAQLTHPGTGPVRNSWFKWDKLGICLEKNDYPKYAFIMRKWTVLSPYLKTYASK